MAIAVTRVDDTRATQPGEHVPLARALQEYGEAIVAELRKPSA